VHSDIAEAFDEGYMTALIKLGKGLHLGRVIPH